MKKAIKNLGVLTLIVCFTSFVLSSFKSTEKTVKWLTNVEEAKALATAQDKKILMSFSGSDWCVNCMKLEKILFESPEFSAFAEANFVLLKLDFPSKKKNQLSAEQQEHNNKLAEIYNKTGQFPTVIILDYDSNVLGKLSYPLNTVKDYILSLQKIIS